MLLNSDKINLEQTTEVQQPVQTQEPEQSKQPDKSNQPEQKELSGFGTGTIYAQKSLEDLYSSFKKSLNSSLAVSIKSKYPEISDETIEDLISDKSITDIRDIQNFFKIKDAGKVVEGVHTMSHWVPMSVEDIFNPLKSEKFNQFNTFLNTDFDEDTRQLLEYQTIHNQETFADTGKIPRPVDFNSATQTKRVIDTKGIEKVNANLDESTSDLIKYKNNLNFEIQKQTDELKKQNILSDKDLEKINTKKEELNKELDKALDLHEQIKIKHDELLTKRQNVTDKDLDEIENLYKQREEIFRNINEKSNEFNETYNNAIISYNETAKSNFNKSLKETKKKTNEIKSAINKIYTLKNEDKKNYNQKLKNIEEKLNKAEANVNTDMKGSFDLYNEAITDINNLINDLNKKTPKYVTIKKPLDVDSYLIDEKFIGMVAKSLKLLNIDPDFYRNVAESITPRLDNYKDVVKSTYIRLGSMAFRMSEYDYLLFPKGKKTYESTVKPHQILSVSTPLASPVQDKSLDVNVSAKSKSSGKDVYYPYDYHSEIDKYDNVFINAVKEVMLDKKYRIVFAPFIPKKVKDLRQLKTIFLGLLSSVENDLNDLYARLESSQDEGYSKTLIESYEKEPIMIEIPGNKYPYNFVNEKHKKHFLLNFFEAVNKVYEKVNKFYVTDNLKDFVKFSYNIYRSINYGKEIFEDYVLGKIDINTNDYYDVLKEAYDQYLSSPKKDKKVFINIARDFIHYLNEQIIKERDKKPFIKIEAYEVFDDRLPDYISEYYYNKYIEEVRNKTGNKDYEIKDWNTKERLKKAYKQAAKSNIKDVERYLNDSSVLTQVVAKAIEDTFYDLQKKRQHGFEDFYVKLRDNIYKYLKVRFNYEPIEFTHSVLSDFGQYMTNVFFPQIGHMTLSNITFTSNYYKDRYESLLMESQIYRDVNSPNYNLLLEAFDSAGSLMGGLLGAVAETAALSVGTWGVGQVVRLPAVAFKALEGYRNFNRIKNVVNSISKINAISKPIGFVGKGIKEFERFAFGSRLGTEKIIDISSANIKNTNNFWTYARGLANKALNPLYATTSQISKFRQGIETYSRKSLFSAIIEDIAYNLLVFSEAHLESYLTSKQIKENIQEWLSDNRFLAIQLQNRKTNGEKLTPFEENFLSNYNNYSNYDNLRDYVNNVGYKSLLGNMATIYLFSGLFDRYLLSRLNKFKGSSSAIEIKLKKGEEFAVKKNPYSLLSRNMHKYLKTEFKNFFRDRNKLIGASELILSNTMESVQEVIQDLMNNVADYTDLERKLGYSETLWTEIKDMDMNQAKKTFIGTLMGGFITAGVLGPVRYTLNYHNIQRAKMKDYAMLNILKRFIDEGVGRSIDKNLHDLYYKISSKDETEKLIDVQLKPAFKPVLDVISGSIKGLVHNGLSKAFDKNAFVSGFDIRNVVNFVGEIIYLSKNGLAPFLKTSLRASLKAVELMDEESIVHFLHNHGFIKDEEINSLLEILKRSDNDTEKKNLVENLNQIKNLFKETNEKALNAIEKSEEVYFSSKKKVYEMFMDGKFGEELKKYVERYGNMTYDQFDQFVLKHLDNEKILSKLFLADHIFDVINDYIKDSEELKIVTEKVEIQKKDSDVKEKDEKEQIDKHYIIYTKTITDQNGNKVKKYYKIDADSVKERLSDDIKKYDIGLNETEITKKEYDRLSSKNNISKSDFVDSVLSKIYEHAKEVLHKKRNDEIQNFVERVFYKYTSKKNLSFSDDLINFASGVFNISSERKNDILDKIKTVNDETFESTKLISAAHMFVNLTESVVITDQYINALSESINQIDTELKDIKLMTEDGSLEISAHALFFEKPYFVFDLIYKKYESLLESVLNDIKRYYDEHSIKYNKAVRQKNELNEKLEELKKQYDSVSKDKTNEREELANKIKEINDEITTLERDINILESEVNSFRSIQHVTEFIIKLLKNSERYNEKTVIKELNKLLTDLKKIRLFLNKTAVTDSLKNNIKEIESTIKALYDFYSNIDNIVKPSEEEISKLRKEIAEFNLESELKGYKNNLDIIFISFYTSFFGILKEINNLREVDFNKAKETIKENLYSSYEMITGERVTKGKFKPIDMLDKYIDELVKKLHLTYNPNEIKKYQNEISEVVYNLSRYFFEKSLTESIISNASKNSNVNTEGIVQSMNNKGFVEAMDAISVHLKQFIHEMISDKDVFKAIFGKEEERFESDVDKAIMKIEDSLQKLYDNDQFFVDLLRLNLFLLNIEMLSKEIGGKEFNSLLEIHTKLNVYFREKENAPENVKLFVKEYIERFRDSYYMLFKDFIYLTAKGLPLDKIEETYRLYKILNALGLKTESFGDKDQRKEELSKLFDIILNIKEKNNNLRLIYILTNNKDKIYNTLNENASSDNLKPYRMSLIRNAIVYEIFNSYDQIKDEEEIPNEEIKERDLLITIQQLMRGQEFDPKALDMEIALEIERINEKRSRFTKFLDKFINDHVLFGSLDQTNYYFRKAVGEFERVYRRKPSKMEEYQIYMHVKNYIDNNSIRLKEANVFKGFIKFVESRISGNEMFPVVLSSELSKEQKENIKNNNEVFGKLNRPFKRKAKLIIDAKSRNNLEKAVILNSFMSFVVDITDKDENESDTLYSVSTDSIIISSKEKKNENIAKDAAKNENQNVYIVSEKHEQVSDDISDIVVILTDKVDGKVKEEIEKAVKNGKVIYASEEVYKYIERNYIEHVNNKKAIKVEDNYDKDIFESFVNNNLVSLNFKNLTVNENLIISIMRWFSSTREETYKLLNQLDELNKKKEDILRELEGTKITSPEYQRLSSELKTLEEKIKDTESKVLKNVKQIKMLSTNMSNKEYLDLIIKEKTEKLLSENDEFKKVFEDIVSTAEETAKNENLENTSVKESITAFIKKYLIDQIYKTDRPLNDKDIIDILKLKLENYKKNSETVFRDILNHVSNKMNKILNSIETESKKKEPDPERIKSLTDSYLSLRNSYFELSGIVSMSDEPFKNRLVKIKEYSTRLIKSLNEAADKIKDQSALNKIREVKKDVLSAAFAYLDINFADGIEEEIQEIKKEISKELVTEELKRRQSEEKTEEKEKKDIKYPQEEDSKELLDAANVLLNNAEKDKTDEALPAEYAGVYISLFRDTEIVKKAIEEFGGEDKLVEAVVKEYNERKGKAYEWWIRFSKIIINFVKSLINSGKITKNQMLDVIVNGYIGQINLYTGEKMPESYLKKHKEEDRKLKPKYYKKFDEPVENKLSIDLSGEQDVYENVDLKISLENIIKEILTEFNKNGHNTLLVGGSVRDALTGKDPKDLDIEVYGYKIDELKNELSKYGLVEEVGESFGVLKFRPIDSFANILEEDEIPESGLIVNIGIPGSGKSTFSNKVVKKYGDKVVVVSTDEIRKELLKDVNDQSKNDMIFKIAEDRIIEALKQGKLVIFDAINIRTKFRNMSLARIYNTLKRENNIKIDVHYKIFKADVDESYKRIQEQLKRGEERADISYDLLKTMYGWYQESIKDIQTSQKAEVYDFTVPRTENKIGKGHRDFEIKLDPNMSVKDAARRRDFTWNSMAYNPITKRLYDYFRGIKDLKDGIIRHVDDKTFAEDPLRILRAMQFQARYGMKIDEATLELMRSMVVGENETFSTVSKMRYYDEFKKWAVKGKYHSMIFEFLRKTGIGERYFPELMELVKVMQDPIHHPEGNVEEHTMQVLAKANEIAEREKLSEKDKLLLIFAALFHDIAKPETFAKRYSEKHKATIITFYGHELKGSEKFESIFRRMMDINEYVDILRPVIREHLAHATLMSIKDEKQRYSAFKKLMYRLDKDNIDNQIYLGRMLLYLMEADMLGRNNANKEKHDTLIEFERLLNKYTDDVKNVKKIEFLINGNDVIKLGVPKGPAIGFVLEAAKEAQLDEKFNDKESALQWLENFIENNKDKIEGLSKKIKKDEVSELKPFKPEKQENKVRKNVTKIVNEAENNEEIKQETTKNVNLPESDKKDIEEIAEKNKAKELEKRDKKEKKTTQKEKERKERQKKSDSLGDLYIEAIKSIDKEINEVLNRLNDSQLKDEEKKMLLEQLNNLYNKKEEISSQLTLGGKTITQELEKTIKELGIDVKYIDDLDSYIKNELKKSDDNDVNPFVLFQVDDRFVGNVVALMIQKMNSEEFKNHKYFVTLKERKAVKESNFNIGVIKKEIRNDFTKVYEKVAKVIVDELYKDLPEKDKKAKEKRAVYAIFWWFVNGAFKVDYEDESRITEDFDKIKEGVKIINQKGIDPLRYARPEEFISEEIPEEKRLEEVLKLDYVKKVDEKVVNGDVYTVVQLDYDHESIIRVEIKKHFEGFTEYELKKAHAYRNFMDIAVSKNFKKWCTCFIDNDGNITERTVKNFLRYNKDYSVAHVFKNGRLIGAFSNEYTFLNLKDKEERITIDEKIIEPNKISNDKYVIEYGFSGKSEIYYGFDYENKKLVEKQHIESDNFDVFEDEARRAFNKYLSKTNKDIINFVGKIDEYGYTGVRLIDKKTGKVLRLVQLSGDRGIIVFKDINEIEKVFVIKNIEKYFPLIRISYHEKFNFYVINVDKNKQIRVLSHLLGSYDDEPYSASSREYELINLNDLLNIADLLFNYDNFYVDKNGYYVIDNTDFRHLGHEVSDEKYFVNNTYIRDRAHLFDNKIKNSVLAFNFENKELRKYILNSKQISSSYKIDGVEKGYLGYDVSLIRYYYDAEEPVLELKVSWEYFAGVYQHKDPKIIKRIIEDLENKLSFRIFDEHGNIIKKSYIAYNEKQKTYVINSDKVLDYVKGIIKEKYEEYEKKYKKEESEIKTQRKEGRVIGAANLKAAEILIDRAYANEDTLPHEFAHFYIRWFYDTPIVQEAIRQFGGEEELVQAIGEQAVKQRGEAWVWWKKFAKAILDFIRSLINSGAADKETLLRVLTDMFLQRVDLVTGDEITKERAKELQKRVIEQLKEQVREDTEREIKITEKTQEIKIEEIKEKDLKTEVKKDKSKKKYIGRNLYLYEQGDIDVERC